MEIDRAAQRVRLDDDSDVAYDALLLATGSRPKKLPVPGADLAGVHYLRTVADASALRQQLEPGRIVVIVGGGYIGLEVAATCFQRGLHVTVLEMAERVMQRAVSPEISSFYESQHAARGIRIVCGARVKELMPQHGTRSVRSVVCEDGSEYPADVVVVGIGVAPMDELARTAGLSCSDGILVDQHCRTSDERIFAAGDCTNHPCVRFGGRVRLESVSNAYEQGATAALNVLCEPARHDKVPWFWSDQLDLCLVIIGLTAGSDVSVTRGKVTSRGFSVCHLRRGELIAVETVNNPHDQMAARKLVGSGVWPNIQKLADPAVPLKDCI